MKHLSLLGSTGSIGTQTLDVIRTFPEKFKVVGLTANRNIGILQEQIKEFKPEAVAVLDKDAADSMKTDIPVYSGIEGLKKIAVLDEADTVVNSLVGSIGVLPTLKAIKAGKNIALANKETLVTAGEIVIDEVKKNNVHLVPIDSEHSAMLQCLNGEKIRDVNKIIVTCSGGPFKSKTRYELENLTAADALKHPTWNMGAKITVDSATLMNKGFEVIEAHWLYSMPYENIEVVIHPQSIVHSLIEFKDRSVIAQLGIPSMKIPIQYALTYPERLENLKLPKLNLAEKRLLTFDKPNIALFPCLAYAYEAGTIGGTLPAVMNAANEVAVQKFLNNQCLFLQIPKTIKQVMDWHKIIRKPVLDDILESDKWARKKAEDILK